MFAAILRVFVSFPGAPSSLRNAFLEDQDISHEPSGPIGFQTTDQQTEVADTSTLSTSLELQSSISDYLFSLQSSDGIADLFEIN